jgi:phosphoglycerol transferase MdoB-like AlkP superfamily enzyme
MNWIEKNLKKVIYIAFLVPILLVALVSISHVTKWYGISNPTSWSIYLSVAVEIAALSTLAAIAARMGKKVYFPFAIVTLIQFIGNVFFAYQFIDIASQSFKDWVDLVSPLVQYLGIENGDFIGHKRFLAFFAGGMLPIISLSFLHMLVKFEEEEKNKVSTKPLPEIEEPKINAKPEDLEKLEIVLNKINEDKFGILVEKPIPEPIVEEPVVEEPIEEEKPGPIKKVLSYLRRDA